MVAAAIRVSDSAIWQQWELEKNGMQRRKWWRIRRNIKKLEVSAHKIAPEKERAGHKEKEALLMDETKYW